MKKIIAFITCFCVLLSVAVVTAAAETYYPTKEETELLNLTQVIATGELSQSEAEATVTRAEFLRLVAKTMKINEYPNIEGVYFTDTADHWVNQLAGYFAQTGIISGNFDKAFEPDRAITKEEAAKILAAVLGFDVLADVQGGFPYGYLKVTSRLKLIPESVNGEPTYGQVLSMMAALMEAPFYEAVTYSEDGSIYVETEDENILSRYHSLYADEGYVRSAVNVSLDGSMQSTNQMVIGDKVYEVDEADDMYVQGFLGMYVKVYYQAKNPDEQRTVRLILPDDIGRVKDISASDVISLDNDYQLWYDENNKSKSYNLERGVRVIYNGSIAGENYKALFDNLQDGTVRLVDADENGAYEYAVIKDYRDMLVSYIDKEDKTLYNKLNGEGVADNTVKFSDYDSVYICDTSYQTVDFSMIKENTILSVAKGSGTDYIELMVSNNVISGMVTATSANSEDTFVTIGDTKYKVSKNYLKHNDLKAGFEGNFYINAFGTIVFADTGDSGFYKYGVLCNTAIEDGFTRKLKIKLFGADGVMHRLDVAEKPKVDGIRQDEAGKVLAAIPGTVDGVAEPQIIRYHLDENGAIDCIDTTNFVEQGESQGDALMATVANSTDTVSNDGVAMPVVFAYSGVKRIGTNVMINDKTVLFYVPEAADIKSGSYDEKEFAIGKYSDLVSDSGLVATGYRANSKFTIEQVLLCQGKNAGTVFSGNVNMVVVKELAEALDDEGSVRTKLVGVINGGDVEYLVSEDYTDEFNKKGLDEGDTIAVGTDALGAVNDVRVIYDVNNGREGVLTPESNGTFNGDAGWVNENRYVYSSKQPNQFYQRFSCSRMFVSYKDSGVVKCVYDINASNFEPYRVCDEAINIGTNSVTIIDKTLESGQKVYSGTVADIRDAASVGADNASELIIHYRNRVIKDYIVYYR